MAGIILRPRSSSVVDNTTGNSPTSVTASRAPKRVVFSPKDLDNPASFISRLNESNSGFIEELAALRSFPFTRGVLLRNIEIYGVMGQVDSITTTTGANDTVSLWRTSDGPLFKLNYRIRAATTDGTTRFTVRTGSQVVLAPGTPAGIVLAGSSWTTAITGLVAGDFLFRASTATDTAWMKNATVTVNHSLGLVPKWFWVAGISAGATPPRISLKSADSQTATFDSSTYSFADIFLVA